MSRAFTRCIVNVHRAALASVLYSFGTFIVAVRVLAFSATCIIHYFYLPYTILCPVPGILYAGSEETGAGHQKNTAGRVPVPLPERLNIGNGCYIMQQTVLPGRVPGGIPRELSEVLKQYENRHYLGYPRSAPA